MHYNGPRQFRQGRNLLSALEKPSAAYDKVIKEVQLGRIAGPFDNISQTGLTSLIISPIGLVPKPSGGVRLIHHLSHPWGEGVNAFIDDSQSKVEFASFDQAIRIALSLGKGALMAKFDVQSAYRLLPVQESDFQCLGMSIGDKIFIDKMLPMGAKISAAHWEAFGHVWEWLVNNAPGFEGQICRYMDDMLCLFHPSLDTTPSILALENVCSEIGLPLAPEKTVAPATNITFLGLTINSVSQTIGIPQDKITRAKEQLALLASKKSLKVRQIQSIAGLLNFLCKAIPPGRPFLRRLFDSIKGKPKHAWTNISSEIKEDAKVWAEFVDTMSDTTPFPPLTEMANADLQLFTDASLLGYGIVCGTSWVMEPFPPFKDPQPSMTWRELYPILVATHVFADKLANKKIKFVTDNMGVYHILRSLSSPQQELMDIVRPLVLQCLKINTRLTSQYVPSLENTLADPLSRLNFQLFKQRAPLADPTPSAIPPHLKLA